MNKMKKTYHPKAINHVILQNESSYCTVPAFKGINDSRVQKFAKSKLNHLPKFVKYYIITSFNWDTQPWIALRQVTDPYLNIFRGLIPPLMGQIDLTPLIGFNVLQMLSSILMAPFANDSDQW